MDGADEHCGFFDAIATKKGADIPRCQEKCLFDPLSIAKRLGF
ncbi:MAG: hypothetical protein ACRC2T_15340 [Thermoguttaceae bacterium]